MPIYLKTKDYEGDVTANGYEEYVEILSTNFEIDITQDRHEAFSAQMGNFIVTKEVDNASTSIFKNSVTSRIHHKITINYVKDAGSKEQTFISYELSDCYIHNYSISTETGQRPIETIEFSYNKIQFTYSTFDEKGKRQGQQVVSHDLRFIRK